MCHNEISATRNDIILWPFRGGTTDVNAFSREALGACLSLCCKALWVAWMYETCKTNKEYYWWSMLLLRTEPHRYKRPFCTYWFFFSKVWSLPPGPVRVWIIDLALFTSLESITVPCSVFSLARLSPFTDPIQLWAIYSESAERWICSVPLSLYF